MNNNVPAVSPLYTAVPGKCEEIPTLTYYPAKQRKSQAAVVIFPGGAYVNRANHEGEGYALMLNDIGIDTFVCAYRVAPHTFPCALLDARRAVRTVRARAEELGLDPTKIAVMGSSAGGHLAALISTYKGVLEGEGLDEIDTLPHRPDLQILCYPVISSEPEIGHLYSYKSMTGCENAETFRKVDPLLLLDADAPPAFIWHTAEDSAVPVANSLRYAEKLAKNKIPYELHVFPYGAHGLGCAPQIPHVAQWTGLLANYFRMIGWIVN